MKITKIILTSLLVFSLSSCVNSDNESTKNTDENKIEKVEEVGNKVGNRIGEKKEVKEVKNTISATIIENTISMEEVKKHNSKGDCYTILEGKVYNVSSFFGIHPGGDENLIKICGIDGSELFTGQHGENTKAQLKKDEFYIGKLK